jgi:hypothetical protein
MMGLLDEEDGVLLCESLHVDHCRHVEPEVQSGGPARRPCEHAFANPSEEKRRAFLDGHFREMDPTAPSLFGTTSRSQSL